LKGTTDSGEKYPFFWVVSGMGGNHETESKKESDLMQKMMNYAMLYEITFQEDTWHTGEKV
jgi:hypothetical protein